MYSTLGTGGVGTRGACTGNEDLRGGGGRLGAPAGKLETQETEVCRGGRGSLTSPDRSSRPGYIRPGDCWLSMTPSAGDGNIRDTTSNIIVGGESALYLDRASLRCVLIGTLSPRDGVRSYQQ